MAKTIIHALIACALGVALGLLWDSEARAANVEVTENELMTMWQRAGACQAAGELPTLCVLHHAPNERFAINLAEEVMFQCRTGNNRSDCVEVRAYIRQRWGVQ